MSEALLLEDTVPAARLRHRIALGLAWIDALGQAGADGASSTVLERIGDFALVQAFERHHGGRFALRYAGLVKKRLDRAHGAGLDTDWRLHVHAPARPGQPAFDAHGDARRYVPRRLRLAAVFDGAGPAPSPANIRRPWLWPGAAYPFPATATLARGSVRRGASPATAVALPWARIFATTPSTQADFGLATVVGCGHGDDRGEYVLALDARAVSGAALGNPVMVRLWAYAPPPAPPAAGDTFLGLVYEDGGSAADSEILRGRAVPPEYTLNQSRVIGLRLGETRAGPDTAFLFGP
jgi:hypothetical protein